MTKQTKQQSKPKAKKSKPKANKNKTSKVVQKPQSSFGEDLGAMVGKGVSSLAKWLGVGAYTVEQNSVIGAGGSIPSMHSTNDSIMVRHREYVGDVISSTTFLTTSLSLNPGIITTYPWLARIAQSFQQYKIRGMVVEYIPEVSEVSANEISLGFVGLAAEYRTDLPSFPSLNQAMESQFAITMKPNCPGSLAVECDPKQSAYSSWYVRTGPVPANNDVKTFDFVNLNVLVGNNQTGGVVLGQVWLTYEIELMRPTSFLDPPANSFYLHVFSSTPTSASPLASNQLLTYINPIGTNAIGASIATRAALDGYSLSSSGFSVAVTLPRGLTGSFCVSYTCVGGSTAAVLGTRSCAVTNATFVNLVDGNNTAASAPLDAVTTTSLLFESYFTISTSQAATGQASFSFGSGTLVLPVTGGGIANFLLYQLVAGAS